MKRGLLITSLLVILGSAVWALRHLFRPGLPPKPRTVEQVRNVLRPKLERRLHDLFTDKEVPYPPPKLILVGLKNERLLQVYAADHSDAWRLVVTYPILGASGGPGPKLREGDQQVPEGFYRIELLNPNSSYHLSLRVNYPNTDDIDAARKEGRELSNLGGDIMIHGGTGSSGCLAMGDPAAEEIFYLVDRAGLDRTSLIIAPKDLNSVAPVEIPPGAPAWTGALYDRIKAALTELGPK